MCTSRRQIMVYGATGGENKFVCCGCRWVHECYRAFCVCVKGAYTVR